MYEHESIHTKRKKWDAGNFKTARISMDPARPYSRYSYERLKLVYFKNIRDFELIKWIGANSFRTSHYPYADEIMDFADQNGIVIINECPGVNLEIFDQPLLEHHFTVMEELVSRDKNRPSVIAWSIANEPRSSVAQAEDYFKSVVKHTKAQDPDHRPVMAVLSGGYNNDLAAPALDMIGINR
jgi:beta-glucuronidase